MRRLFQKYRGLVVIAALLALPLVFLYVQARGQESSGRLDRAVQWFTGPIQSGLYGAWTAVSDAVDRYVALVGVTEENETLRTQIDKLKRELQDREEQRLQNERLLRLLALSDRLPRTRTLAARVIAFGQSPSYRTLRVNRGAADGVERRAGVVTADGVVGRVISVSQGYADVLLITDGGSRLDVLAKRTRARGVLSGGGAGAPCRIDSMDRTLELKNGDILLTSGLDGVFPKGVPVGMVSEVNYPTMGNYLDAAVEPFASFSKLEEVQVLVRAPAEYVWPRVAGSALPPDFEDAGVLDSGADGGPNTRPGASSRPRHRRGRPGPDAGTAPQSGRGRPDAGRAARGARRDGGAGATGVRDAAVRRPAAKPTSPPAAKPGPKPAPKPTPAAAVPAGDKPKPATPKPAPQKKDAGPAGGTE